MMSNDRGEAPTASSLLNEDELRTRLERTSARALRALQEKDDIISSLRAELADAKRSGRRWDVSGDENAFQIHAFKQQQQRAAPFPFRDENADFTRVGNGRDSYRRANLDRELEKERAQVISLKRQLRQQDVNVERLTKSHEEAKSFALTSERHATQLTEALNRFLANREDRKEELLASEEAFNAERESMLLRTQQECSIANDDAHRWRARAVALEAELQDLCAVHDERDADDSDDDELSRPLLRARLAETRVALNEALQALTARAGEPAAVLSTADVDVLRISARTSQREVRDTARHDGLEAKVASLKNTVKELTKTNSSQFADLLRLENLLREQVAVSKSMTDNASSMSETLARERKYFSTALRDKELELTALRDTVVAIESERLSSDERFAELRALRETLYALQREHSTVANDRELLASEVRQLRQECKTEAERADAFESMLRTTQSRENLLLDQLDWKSDACARYMDAEIDLLHRLDEADHAKVEAEVKSKSLERSLEMQVKRFGDFVGQHVAALSDSVRESISNDAVRFLASSEKFRQDVLDALSIKGTDRDSGIVGMLMEAQKTIVQLETRASKYEVAFEAALRSAQKSEHRADSTKTALDHVCAVLEVTKESYASLSAKTMAMMEDRVTSSNARCKQLLHSCMIRGGVGFADTETDDDSFQRDERIRMQQARIDELEATALEIVGAREAAAKALQAMSIARDTAKKEVFEERDRVVELRRGMEEAQVEISNLRERLRNMSCEKPRADHEDQIQRLHALIEEQAKTIADASVELSRRETREAEYVAKIDETEASMAEMRTKYEEALDAKDRKIDELTRERAAALQGEQQLVVRRNDAAQAEISSSEAIVRDALDDNRVAAVVAAAARRDTEAALAEVERLRAELTELKRRQSSHASASFSLDGLDEEALVDLQAHVEFKFNEQREKYEAANAMLERDVTTLQAYADVMTARLLNMESELVELKQKETECLEKSKPDDAERRRHVERCKRYRDLMERLKTEHERERAKLLEFAKASEEKIAELTKRVENSWAGELEQEVASLKAQLLEMASATPNAQGSDAAELVRLQKEIEATRLATEKQTAQRFMRQAARHEDEIERLRDRCQQSMRPALEMLESVRELTKICIIHSMAGRGGESNKRAMDDDAKDKALALGVLNASEIEDVFHVPPTLHVGANATAEEVAAALKSAQPLDAEAKSMALKWIDGKCNALAGMLKAPLTVDFEDVWRGDRLDELCHLANVVLLADEAIDDYETSV